MLGPAELLSARDALVVAEGPDGPLALWVDAGGLHLADARGATRDLGAASAPIGILPRRGGWQVLWFESTATELGTAWWPRAAPLAGGASKSLSPQLEAVSAVSAGWFEASASAELSCVGPPWALDCAPASGPSYGRALPVPTTVLAWDLLVVDDTLWGAWIRSDGRVDVGFARKDGDWTFVPADLQGSRDLDLFTAAGRPCLSLPAGSGVTVSCLR